MLPPKKMKSFRSDCKIVYTCQDLVVANRRAPAFLPMSVPIPNTYQFQHMIIPMILFY